VNSIASLAVTALSDEEREQMSKDVREANKRSEDNARTRG
jgi:hypothetical protein